MFCGWGVKAGMVPVWVAGKTVWSPSWHAPYLSALAVGSSHLRHCTNAWLHHVTHVLIYLGNNCAWCQPVLSIKIESSCHRELLWRLPSRVICAPLVRVTDAVNSQDVEGSDNIWIQAGRLYAVPVCVSVPGTVLTWQFSTRPKVCHQLMSSCLCVIWQYWYYTLCPKKG